MSSSIACYGEDDEGRLRLKRRRSNVGANGVIRRGAAVPGGIISFCFLYCANASTCQQTDPWGARSKG